jgi:hypothetical protein
MSGYSFDRKWSDQFIPEMCRIVGPHLLIPSTLEQDIKQAADLVVLKASGVTIACRVRRSGYVKDYGNQFTIRSQRLNGSKTELEKIVDGWGDWMFYAHANEKEDGFALWHLLDLSAWRAHLIRNLQKIECGKKLNRDGATEFAWFSISSFVGKPDLVIASSTMFAKVL